MVKIKFGLKSHDLKVHIAVTREINMQYAYQSMRLDLDRLNAMRPPASVYLASVRSCKQSTHVTLPELILNQSH